MPHRAGATCVHSNLDDAFIGGASASGQTREADKLDTTARTGLLTGIQDGPPSLDPLLRNSSSACCRASGPCARPAPRRPGVRASTEFRHITANRLTFIPPVQGQY